MEGGGTRRRDSRYIAGTANTRGRERERREGKLEGRNGGKKKERELGVIMSQSTTVRGRHDYEIT